MDSPNQPVRSSRRFEGFTIVELLVVLSIIGVLVAIALPAVLSAREGARLSSCHATQTKLGLAISRFCTVNGVLPGWRNKLDLNSGVTHTYVPTVPSASPAPSFTRTYLNASWAVTLLPQLGRTDLYEQMKAKKIWENGITGDNSGVPIAEFICPSAGSASTWQMYPYATLMYGVNVADNDSTDGVLVDRVGTTIERTLDDIRSWDGLSTTFLVADAFFSGNRWPGGWGPAWHVDMFDKNYPTSKYRQDKANLLGARGSVRTPVINNQGNLSDASLKSLPQAAHPGGAVLTFCDGSTRFVRESIAPHVYGHLATSRSLFNGTNYRTSAGGVNGNSASDWLMSGRTPAVEPYKLSDSEY